MVVSLRDLNHQLASKSKQVDELLADKENVTGELREHTEQYRDRLLEQMEQIKNLKELVEKKDALIETMRKEHYDAEEHARAVMEEKIEKVGELQERLDKVEMEKDKVSKNCFEQMSLLSAKLEEVKELEAEKEAFLQREKQRDNDLAAAQHDLEEFRTQAMNVEQQLEEFKDLVEEERRNYKDAQAEIDVYSEQVKRLEMAVFESDMKRKDSSEKSKAKLRAVMSEKDNISAAYLKTTMRLAQAKEASMEAQELAAAADSQRDGLRRDCDRLEGELNDKISELAKLKKKLKKEKKERFKAEEDMKEANRRWAACGTSLAASMLLVPGIVVLIRGFAHTIIVPIVCVAQGNRGRRSARREGPTAWAKNLAAARRITLGMVAENNDMRHGEWLTGSGATATRVATNISASSQFSLVSVIHVILTFEYSACGRFNVQCTVLCMIVR